MRLRGFVFSLVVLVLLACGSPGGPTPTPTPTPSPSPTPIPGSITEPLRMENGRFFPTLLGGIICCGDGTKERGWPLITNEALAEYAAAGANYTHLRTGPHKASLEGEEFVAYNPDGSFREAYFERIASIVRRAGELGIYVETDLVDGWGPKTNNAAWPDGARCEIFEHAPDALREAWIRKLVRTTAPFVNTIYQDGNEIGVLPCGNHLSAEWVLGLIAIVRDEEARLGIPPRLLGTNTGRSEFEALPGFAYISRHTETAQAPEGGKPVQVNEGAGLSPEDWATQARLACEQGTVFHAWSYDWTEAERAQALALMKQLRSGACR